MSIFDEESTRISLKIGLYAKILFDMFLSGGSGQFRRVKMNIKRQLFLSGTDHLNDSHKTSLNDNSTPLWTTKQMQKSFLNLSTCSRNTAAATWLRPQSNPLAASAIICQFCWRPFPILHNAVESFKKSYLLANWLHICKVGNLKYLFSNLAIKNM